MNETLSNISKGETLRRQDLTDNLSSDIDKLDKSAREIHPNNMIASNDRIDLLENKSSPRTSRKFGIAKETEQTKSLNNEQLLQLQKSTINSQDDALKSLLGIFHFILGVVQRQKEIGKAIGDEIDYQNGILDEVDDMTSRVSTNLTIVDRKIKKILEYNCR
jgi:regulator of vacuolar morphogenesis